jgi:hypothetical protein
MTIRSSLRTASAVAIGAILLGLIPTATAVASSGSNDLSRLRAATAAFHSIKAAEAAQYGKFSDVHGITCIADVGANAAMGVHYVNGTLVGDPTEDVTKPEALVYAPGSDGHLHLAAVEYLVVQAAWTAAGHTAPPSLFGQTFMAFSAPNRYGLPPFYALHVWAWKTNPLGMFSPWNPNVTCPAS